jgi:hypothetical protein
MPTCRPISRLPLRKMWRSGRSDEQKQPSDDLSKPADLDLAFAETVEAMDFDWPTDSSVERVQVGIAEMSGGILLLTGLVVLIQRTISLLGSAIAWAKKMDIDLCNKQRGKK